MKISIVNILASFDKSLEQLNKQIPSKWRNFHKRNFLKAAVVEILSAKEYTVDS